LRLPARALPVVPGTCLGSVPDRGRDLTGQPLDRQRQNPDQNADLQVLERMEATAASGSARRARR
jgi:hypothetical protein